MVSVTFVDVLYASRRLPRLWIFFFTFYMVLDVRLQALELDKCKHPLGMESGAISDKDITASSAYDSASVGPQHGRLRNDHSGGAWCPKKMVTREAHEYLEIDLHDLHVITGTKTQGRYGNGQGQEYAEEFMLDYWRTGFTKWMRWRSRDRKEILAGNINTYTEKEQEVDPPIRATKIRFVPYSDHMRTVCMRVELLGCRSQNGLVSYSVMQGYHKGVDVDFRDRTYDGIEENGFLSGGLGQLTDGERGGDNLKLYFRGNNKGYEWVGWRNDTPGLSGRPVEITFEFDAVRNFSAVNIFTNNMFTREVQVFSRALVYFSIGGRQFSSIPVTDSSGPDLLTEHARNVTVKLHHRIGRFVKLELYFANRWILLSEVTFDSVIINGNFTDEEMDNRVILPMEDHGFSKEYPLQRDEVQTTPSRDDRRQSMVPPSLSFNEASEPKQYIGLVIGILSTVIIILIAAITFIVVRHRRLHSALGGATNTVIPGGFVNAGPGQKGVTINMKDFQMRVNVNANGHVYGQVSVDDPEDKAAIYHEPFNVNMFSGRRALEPLKGHLEGSRHPNYSDIPDIVGRNDDYAVPQISETPPPPFPAPPLTPARALPSLHNFFPKPPPVPPPCEKFYAATEICKTGLKDAPQITDRTVCSPVYNTLSLSRLLSDNNTDSEFPVTETEDEACEDDVSVHQIRYDQLRVLEHLGYGQFGEVKLCEITGKCEYLLNSPCKLVAVKELRPGASESTREDFKLEVRALSKIKDPNIVRVLGASFDVEPVFVAVEYMENGDLNQYLQEHVADTTTPLPTNAKTLSYGCLIYMATQIASGMKYLESLNFVHRDLATRNCLVGKNYSIKVTDLGMSRSLYSSDYYQVEGDAMLPIRWMSWESILLGKFTTKSDVWSFAVTLWEILTFAREQPYEDLCDEKVIENVKYFYQDYGKHLLLHQPKNCPKEIYDLMRECWQRNESDRPNFREIHLFLQRKNLGYKPSMD